MSGAVPPILKIISNRMSYKVAFLHAYCYVGFITIQRESRNACSICKAPDSVALSFRNYCGLAAALRIAVK
jgi:hypothetical protein